VPIGTKEKSVERVKKYFIEVESVAWENPNFRFTGGENTRKGLEKGNQNQGEEGAIHHPKKGEELGKHSEPALGERGGNTRRKKIVQIRKLSILLTNHGEMCEKGGGQGKRSREKKDLRSWKDSLLSKNKFFQNEGVRKRISA